MTAEPAARMSITTAAARIAARELSPVTLTEACLQVIEAREPDLGAFALVDGERALAHARLLADELVQHGPRSPLHGVPIAIKDLFDVAGLPTRAGSAVLGRASPAATDAAPVAALRRAGAVPIGKTHTHEFALGAVTPQTRHPTHPDRIAGGSSGGSAAAVAAYEAFGALGTDTGGSVRLPAALCGVTGLKARNGAIPLEGVVPLSPLLDSCGVLARDVSDVELLWNALGPPARPRPHGSLRIGVVADSSLGRLSSDVADATAASAAALGKRGDVELITVTAPPFDDWSPARLVPLLADALEVHRARGWYPRDSALYGGPMRAALDQAATLTTADLVGALRTLMPLAERLMDCLLDCDALLLPTVEDTAPPAEPAPPEGRALLRLCAPVNWCPLAAISVPNATAPDGLPIAVQFVAREEATVLECARRHEVAQGLTPREQAAEWPRVRSW